ncbi:MAG: hypothetical protein HUU20_06350 [Pirellulales bacterium]|nr:hypothetical protein [Pirellulales bacterium]
MTTPKPNRRRFLQGCTFVASAAAAGLTPAAQPAGEAATSIVRFPTIGTSAAGRATLLAIDDYHLPLRKNLCYYLSKPAVRPEPVLKPERENPAAPDHVAAHFYGTVLHEAGRFRLWYYSLSWKAKGQFQEGPICYAESDDGLHFTKPVLEQVDVQGSRRNNAIALPDDCTQGAFLLRDDDDPDPARRYKMVYEYRPSHRRWMSVRTATSPDGLHWTAGPESPVDEGLEPCSFYKHGGLYYTNAQFAPALISEGGHKGGRQGFVWVTPDFKSWIQESGESFLLAEPANTAGRGLDKPYDQVHLGVAPVSLGNALVGLYCIWHAKPNPNDWFGQGTTSGDWGLVVSHDGQHFREAVKGHVFLHRDESRPVLPPEVRFENILCQGNGIVNVGEETRIYHGRWVNSLRLEDYYAEIGLATLPRDRWGALGLFPGAQEGSVWSAPVILPLHAELTLNAEGAAGMRIEIADERFQSIPEFSGEKAGSCLSAGGLAAPVKWPGDIASLAGKTVRLRAVLRRGSHPEPRLYAIYLK